MFKNSNKVEDGEQEAIHEKAQVFRAHQSNRSVNVKQGWMRGKDEVCNGTNFIAGK